MAERYPLPVGFDGPDWTAIAQRADYAQTECFRSIGREAARAKRLFLRRRLRGKRAPARVSFRYAAVTRKTDSSYGRQENEEATKHSLARQNYLPTGELAQYVGNCAADNASLDSVERARGHAHSARRLVQVMRDAPPLLTGG